MSAAFRIEGVAGVLSEARRQINLIEGRSIEGLYEGANIVAVGAQMETPVDTGDLRREVRTGTFRYANEGGSFVAYDMHYATFVHENLFSYHRVGSSKFLEKSVHENAHRVVDAVIRRARIS